MAILILTTVQIAPIQPLDAPTSLISSIPMVHACQIVLIQEEMNGKTEHISAILLVLLGTLTPRKTLVWTHANLNLCDSKTIFSIAMVTLIPIMAQIVLTLPLDVLLFGISNILMAHACQAVPIHVEMSGTMVHISAILPALLDILIS
jgi:cellobiose-specific phosphotransferase system component IIA